MTTDPKEMLAEGPVTRLHIGDERITLEVLSDHNQAARAIDAGSARKLLGCLRHEPATAEELESAISEIEDGLMPAVRQLPAHRRLITSAPEARRIANVLRADNLSAARLEIAEVEELFNRLADVAYGTPAARLGLPVDRSFVATLLILRELLHHGGFASVQVVQ